MLDKVCPFLLFTLVLIGPLSGVGAETLQLDLQTTADADGAYRTVGRMTLPFPAPVVSKAMVDFDHYDAWAPRGQDGKDPASAGYIGQLTGVRAGVGTLDLIYRINLLWPFGSSGQAITLGVEVPSTDPATTQVRFVLLKPSFVTPIVEGVFSLHDLGPQECEVELDSRVKLAWFLLPFFPLDGYRTHVVKRIETALRSFAADLASTHG